MLYEVFFQAIFDNKVIPVTSFRLVENWDVTSVKAEITVPQIIRVKGATQRIDQILVKGSKIKIVAGIYPHQTTELIGYVNKIIPGEETTIELLDAGYCLTQFFVKKTYPKDNLLSVRQLVNLLKTSAGKKWLYDDVKILSETKVGINRINNVRGDLLLNNLRTEFGLYSFTLDNVLYIGLNLDPKLALNPITLDFSKHIIDESDLEYSNDYQPVFIKIVSINGNSKIKYETGTKGAYTINITVHNQTMEAIKRIAENNLKKGMNRGYAGSIVTLGYPRVRMGNSVELVDPASPERRQTMIVTGRELVIDNSVGITQKLSVRALI